MEVAHVRALLDSFRLRLGRDLIARGAEAVDDARRLYVAPFVVLSHGTESDPLLNYANAAALRVWETTSDDFIGMPSRLTAEPHNRQARAAALQQSMQHGYATGYSGVRISRTGRRFRIADATLWTISDAEGRPLGQAAMFETALPIA